MLLKNSRYQPPRPFEPDAERPTFDGIRPRRIEAAAGVIEHTIEVGQRLDWLAWHYYNDSRLWWRILDANRDLLFGGEVLLDHMAGEVLLIPQAQG
jgi:hypothetical protein